MGLHLKIYLLTCFIFSTPPSVSARDFVKEEKQALEVIQRKDTKTARTYVGWIRHDRAVIL